MSEEKKKPRYECRNALYFKANDYSDDDIVLVKEKIHLPNGEVKDNLRIIQNYQREIYIHKEGYRKYKQKKVWKPKSEMDVYRTTEAKKGDTIKKALGIPLGHYMPIRQICRSPYVYGVDLSTTSLIKKKYTETWPLTVSNATVAVLDIETSVLGDNHGEIIAVALSFKDKAIVATTKDFLGTTVNPENRFYQLLDKITPEVRRNRHCNVEFVICDNPALAIIEVFNRAHDWKPDFITGWNLMGFDIPKIEQTLVKYGYDPADVLSDPIVEKRFRSYRYNKGPTVSPRGNPYAGYEQWHWVSVPASFFFLDSMCLYYQIRKGEPLEENYKLDTILNKEINRGKVGIEEAEHLDGVDKHRFMQTKYKLEYLVYNLFDCIGVELLDEKTKDIHKTLPILVGASDLGNFTSNPKNLFDAISFYVQEDKDFDGVMGSVSDELKTELDEHVPPLSGWIVALPTERLQDIGNRFLKELPNHRTKVHAQCSDIDVSSGYPNIERATNMSKDTTVHELSQIEGLTFDDQRKIGLNMMGGKSNSLRFATMVYRLPKADDLWKMYNDSLQGN